MKNAIMIALLAIFTLTGCASVGGPVIVRDRYDYSVAIAESWKSQMLLNIVKIRYADTPVFMDVTSVINLVGVQNTVNMGAGWSFPPSGNTQSVGGSTTWGEKPTITYAPLSGEKFTKSLLTPISHSSLLHLIQAGWPVRLLFGLCVKSINDMDNQTSAPGFAQTEDPEFQKLIGLLEKIQKSGAVGIRIEKKDRQEASVVIAYRGKASREIMLDRSEAAKLLGLKPETTEFKVIYGTVPMQEGEIAMLTRSIMDIIIELSAQIEVPADQAAEGRTYAASPAIGDGKGQESPLVRIHSSKEKPSDSFVCMNYRDHWFWIDDRDRQSKTIFSFLMILFSLVETGAPPQAPTITVPIG
jgi:hypothetical protein